MNKTARLLIESTVKCGHAMVMVPFVLALPIGFAIGHVKGTKDSPGEIPLPEPRASAETRSRQDSPDLDQLLRDYKADDHAWSDGSADPLADLLSGWTEAELENALSEAMLSPRCLALLGESNGLPWDLFAAWMKKNPDTAVAWADKLKSAEMRDQFLREACRNWPTDRAMEGVEYMLAHHWREGGTYPRQLLTGALESQARAGVAEVEALLQRLTAARVDIQIESLGFPPNFDYPSLVSSAAFLAHGKILFQDVVFSAWRTKEPDRLLTWMEETGEWQHFQGFLNSSKGDELLQAARFWDDADSDLRQSIIGKIQWSEITPELVENLVRQTKEPEGQDLLIGRYIQTSYGTDQWKSNVSTLEMIPSAERRMAILKQLYPETDWRPDAPETSGDPPNARIMREAIGGWGIEVSPPASRQPEIDPFATEP